MVNCEWGVARSRLTMVNPEVRMAHFRDEKGLQVEPARCQLMAKMRSTARVDPMGNLR